MNKKKFGNLLSKAIKNISIEQNLKIAEVQTHLSTTLAYGESTIEYWRRGNIPNSYDVLEKLITELIRLNGIKDTNDIENFFTFSGYSQKNFQIGDKFKFSGVQQNTAQNFQKQNFPYRVIKRHEVKKYFWDGKSILERFMQIQSSSDFPLDKITRTTTLMGLPLTDEKMKIQFDALPRENNGQMRFEISAISQTGYKQNLFFNPPLMKGEYASYKITRVIQNSQVDTLEYVTELFRQNVMSVPYNTWSLKADVPMDELSAVVIFPLNYKVSLPASGGLSVKISGVDDNDEKTSLIQRNAFLFSIDDEGCQTLNLKVKYPQIGRSYSVEWIPPRESDLNKVLSQVD